MNRLSNPTLDWTEVREFLVRRKFLRNSIGPDLYAAVIERRVDLLNAKSLRELSVFIAGYRLGRP